MEREPGHLPQPQDEVLPECPSVRNDQTSVLVKREGQFSSSGNEMLDEIEIFKGSENSLVMVQSYTHKFQCAFQLEKYPFDTQVRGSALEIHVEPV